MKNILTITLLTIFTSAFGQSVSLERWEIKSNKIKSITATNNFQFNDGTGIKKVSNIMDITYYDTLGAIVKLIVVDVNHETQTDFIYNENNTLVGTKRSYKFISNVNVCGGRPVLVKKVQAYDKNGLLKFEKTLYRKRRLPFRVVKVNYFYNNKGLLDKKVYVRDDLNKYIQFKYEYYE